MSNRPDRPLVVKCTFDKSHKKITFSSSQNCSFELLKHKIEQCFALSAATYAVSWKDDDGETTSIVTEDDLSEAICYFGSGDDASGSILSGFSGRSFGRKAVTLRVTISIDYDGPSLSDTSSLASLEEFRSRNGSRRSFSFTAGSVELDDDSVTVSSRDHLGSASSTASNDYRLRPSSPPEDLTKPSPTLRNTPHSDGSYVGVSNGHGHSDFSFSDLGADVRSASDQNDDLSAAMERYPADPSAVFARLKIRETLGDDQSDWDDASVEEDRGARWLREQKERAIRTKLGVEPEPSISDDDSYACRSLSLEMNNNGQYYYNYNASSGSQSQADPFEDRSLESISEEDYTPSPSKRIEKPRATSMHLNWLAAQHLEMEEHRRLQTSASQTSLGSGSSGSPKVALQDDGPIIDKEFKYYNLPAPPEEIVTGCSNCGVSLESMRYVCSTCGENPPVSRTKGKKKDHDCGLHYPPSPRPSCGSSPGSGSSPSQSYLGSVDSLFNLQSRKFYHNLPALSSSISIFSSRTRVDEPPPPPESPRSGFELCVNCFETEGISHSIDSGLGSPSSSATAFGQSSSSLQPQDSSWRTSAPKKGHTRHAFIEKMWSDIGWQNVSQDEGTVSVCTTCHATTGKQRYKCAVCPKFNLCKACYNVVHHLHPVHAFILVPDAPTFPSPIEVGTLGSLANGLPNADSIEEPAMPAQLEINCTHCLLPIVGAIFHCAICDSIDICSNCEAAGLPGNLESADGGHNSTHILIKIPYVLERSELQTASRAAMDLWRGRDSAVAISASKVASQANAAYAQTVLITFDYTLTAHFSHFYINSLSLERGTSVPTARHTRSGTIWYSVPAGPPPNNPRCDDPREYLKYLRHSIALCDRCMRHIEGEWFRCAYCPIDLCDACEDVDTHADDHFFVVFKSTVSTHPLLAKSFLMADGLDLAQIDLKAFKSFTNPEEPTPIVTYPIYK
ncbi:hypothetical protein EST38_g1863 [Candolleomyces aberdarensis]|uniref:PB1 domain-containing protein n=1 Tax=Candolleomyces aberdarensis TaxID=2316362 RepID=A0A4Q2DUB6_9AGAR|nr:hypothetical protein EST38_g1863 [Candolleomyces aberdarensis]